MARKTVGDEGFVLGVDIRPIEPFLESNVRTIIGDITEEGTVQQILKLLPRKADAVISDTAPNISGVWEVDHARQMDLAQQALEITLETLEPSGTFFTKVFQGDMLREFIDELKQHFEIVKIMKPKASRAKSSEIFLIGIHLKRTAR